MIDLLYFGLLTALSLIILYIFVNQYFLSIKYYETQRRLTQTIIMIFFDFFIILLRSMLNINIDVFYSLLIFEFVLDFIIMASIADIFSAINNIQYPNSIFKRKIIPIITTIIIILITLSLSFLFTNVLANSNTIEEVSHGLQKYRLIPYILLIFYIILITPKNKHIWRPIRISFGIILIGFVFELLYLFGMNNFE